MLRNDLITRFPALTRLPADCHVVGGAIRDLLSGTEPADVDVVAIDAEAAARSLGGRVVKLGRGDLVAYRVIVDGTIYDLAGRVGATVEEDLSRRDFTVDAIAVSLQTGEQIDPHDGHGDLHRRTLRMIRAGNFDDDPLRLVKGVRLAVTLGFTFDEATLDAMRQRAESITRVAPERVTYELALAFGCGRLRQAIEFLHATGLDVPLFGKSLDDALFHDDAVSLAGALTLLVDDPETHAVRWRWSESLSRQVLAIRELLKTPRTALRMALHDAGQDAAKQLPGVLRALGRPSEAIPQDEAFFAIRALLSGAEISELTGLQPGRELGAIKRSLLEAQLDGAVATREEAETFVKNLAE